MEVTLELTNNATIEHEWVILEQGTELSRHLGAGMGRLEVVE